MADKIIIFSGLPANFGKKNKQTTEQAIFECKLCERELKSIVTLRDHCKVRQGLQLFLMLSQTVLGKLWHGKLRHRKFWRSKLQQKKIAADFLRYEKLRH